MEHGFHTWKEVLEVIVIPMTLAAIALLWPVVQNLHRRRRFTRLILRELCELQPDSPTALKGHNWSDHQKRQFLHKKILESPSENRDFILSLPPDLIYSLSQLWEARAIGDSKEWLFQLDKFTSPKYDKTGEIRTAFEQWRNLIIDYDQIERGVSDTSSIM
jgi:hypothetical protein